MFSDFPLFQLESFCHLTSVFEVRGPLDEAASLLTSGTLDGFGDDQVLRLFVVDQFI